MVPAESLIQRGLTVFDTMQVPRFDVQRHPVSRRPEGKRDVTPG